MLYFYYYFTSFYFTIFLSLIYTYLLFKWKKIIILNFKFSIFFQKKKKQQKQQLLSPMVSLSPIASLSQFLTGSPPSGDRIDRRSFHHVASTLAYSPLAWNGVERCREWSNQLPNRTPESRSHRRFGLLAAAATFHQLGLAP